MIPNFLKNLCFYTSSYSNLRRFKVMHRFAPPIQYQKLNFDYKLFSIQFFVDRPKKISIRCFNRPTRFIPIILRLFIVLVHLFDLLQRLLSPNVVNRKAWSHRRQLVNFCQIRKDCYKIGDRLSKNDKKYQICMQITKRCFQLSIKIWDSV